MSSFPTINADDPALRIWAAVERAVYRRKQMFTVRAVEPWRENWRVWVDCAQQEPTPETIRAALAKVGVECNHVFTTPQEGLSLICRLEES